MDTPDGQNLTGSTKTEQSDSVVNEGNGVGVTRIVIYAVALLLVLVGGVALGVYAVPGGILPGDPDLRSALLEADQRIVDMDVIVSSHEMLRSEISAGIGAASEQGGVSLTIVRFESAVRYSVRVEEQSTCADFVGFGAGADLQVLRVTDAYPC